MDCSPRCTRRHCTTLNRERVRLLTEARRTGLQLESVIEAFVRPALTEIQGGDGKNHYSRLRATLAAEDAPLFTQIVADNFDQSSRTFVTALRECLADLPADEVLWRFHFMLGTIYYSASSPQRIQGVFARPLRSRRCGGDGAAPGAVPRCGVPFRARHPARPAAAPRGHSEAPSHSEAANNDEGAPMTPKAESIAYRGTHRTVTGPSFPRFGDIAHLGHMELFTPKPDEAERAKEQAAVRFAATVWTSSAASNRRHAVERRASHESP